MIENSAKGENHMFRNLYAELDGQEKDILGNGQLSCAIFASAVLYFNKLIKDIHGTVAGLERDLIASGWLETKELCPGAVLIWEKQAADDGSLHRHAGFYVGNDEAISNDSKGTGFPHRHHVTYNDTRQIEKIYWHPFLDGE